ncbi:putative RING-H2 finger protein ATL21A [Henckelia pumila]|uniref:putative RING-H2 finger protein ATL21A n=1 Tax=Henckelia pumila TaxID=405737 RepID=UPI003C6E2CB5
MYHPRYCFFVLINLVPLIHSINQKCPVSSCGNSYFSIQYPFVLQGERPQICSNYTSLGCNPGNKTILSLPSSGDFYVSEINYNTQTVQLYDPSNCLPRRLMNLSLSSSIFTSAYYQNYTFYSCPAPRYLIGGFTPIDCLSTDSDTVVASSKASPADMWRVYQCTIITTARIPVSWLGQFDNSGIYSDLQLSWVVPRCEDCEQYPETDKGRSNWSKIVQSPLLSPLGLVASVISMIACAVCQKKIRDLNRASASNGDIAAPPLAITSAVALPPQSTGGGGATSTTTTTTTTTDDPKVDSYTISMNFEEKSGTSCPRGSTCVICLEDYREKEKIKCIILCQHCFHAYCIDQWLQKHWSCPVCRTSLS